MNRKKAVYSSWLINETRFNLKYAIQPTHVSFWHLLGEFITPQVVAKKIVSRLRLSLNRLVTIFRKSPGTNLVSNLSQHLEYGATKLHVYKMVDAVHRKRTRLTCAQNKILFQLLDSLCQHLYSSSWEFIPNFSFTRRQFDMVQISNDHIV